MKPICAPCRRFFRPKKTGIWFVENMPRLSSAPPGNEAPEEWRPYKLWRGDLWECLGCGAQIVSGVAREPVAEHYEPNFAAALESTAPTITVNDC